MSDILLGKLKKVENLRLTWEKEDRDFTQWLSLPENLAVLEDAIGVDLTLESTEKNIGPFRADIVCQDEFENFVLIENQLEKTDHRHLGQLITYAAGLDASNYDNEETTIVWIADKFVDEHRSALEWLNKITTDEFRFFGLEIELWQIDNSKPALKFNVAVQPNNWAKMVKKTAKKLSQDLSPLQEKQQEYWEKLSQYLKENSFVSPTAPRPQQWYVFSIGRAGFAIHTTIHSKENRMGVELYISHQDSKEYFERLYSMKQEVEEKISAGLEWRKLPNRKGSRIVIFKAANFNNEDAWDEDMVWFKDTLEKFDEAFRSLIQNLDIQIYEEEEAA